VASRSSLVTIRIKYFANRQNESAIGSVGHHGSQLFRPTAIKRRIVMDIMGVKDQPGIGCHCRIDKPPYNVQVRT